MTPRRTALLGIGLLAVAAAGLIVWRAGSIRPAANADGPVIIISIDTLRADHLRAYGYANTRTPAIDALAADGVLFENAYAHAPQTLPSHVSILSGRLPFEHGVRDNIGFTVKPSERMLQHAMHDRGFATAGFVSSYVLRRQTGISAGFDAFDDAMGPAGQERRLGDLQRSGAETLASAERWLAAQTSPKLFLFFHIYEPHTPYTPSYDADIETADGVAGRLIAALRARGWYDRATIVLLSDHGEGLGDHGEEEHGIFLYRETLHVPLIVKLPGGAQAGRRVKAPVQHIDLVPTLLDLTGGIGGQTFPGRSLRAAMDGSGALPPASIYAEALAARYHYGWSELYALTDERYRLIRAPRDELFDLAQDPREARSIAAERPQVRAAMRGALNAIIARTPVTAPSAVSNADREKLAALGYVGTQSSAIGLDAPAGALPDPKDKIGVLRQYRRASALAGERRYAEAIDAYRELLRSEPGMADVWLQLAGVYEQRGMLAPSLDAYKQAIARRPGDPAALTGAAAALMQLGRFDEARAHAELAIASAPAIAHELLARLAVQRGDAAAARTHATAAQQADPTLPMPALIEGLLLYNQGNYAAAAAPLTDASRAMRARTEQIPDVNYLLADSLARLERYAEAEALFKAELATTPGHLRARGGLAMLYAATGRSREAEAAVEELVRISPTPAGYTMAAKLWDLFGQPRRAAAARAHAR